jgi:hypothetical protein
MKVIKSSIGSLSHAEFNDSNIRIASGTMSMVVDKDGGNYFQGPVSFSSPFTSMRFGGIFKFNPMLFLGIPSTIVTPMPTFIIDPPIKNLGTMVLTASIILSAV